MYYKSCGGTRKIWCILVVSGTGWSSCRQCLLLSSCSLIIMLYCCCLSCCCCCCWDSTSSGSSSTKNSSRRHCCQMISSHCLHQQQEYNTILVVVVPKVHAVVIVAQLWRIITASSSRSQFRNGERIHRRLDVCCSGVVLIWMDNLLVGSRGSGVL